MITRIASARRGMAVAVSALICAGLVGCVQDIGVAWLPDSSGIVYTTGPRVTHYDLKHKAGKAIVEDTKTLTYIPGVSADGKKVAVAEEILYATKDSTEERICRRIIIYGLDGEELSRSKVYTQTRQLDKPAEKTEKKLGGSWLNWSGPADKILVLGAGIYDLKRDRFIPLDVNLYPLYNRPVRPDGKGFFCVTKEGFAFYDWDGWGRSFGKVNLPKLPGKASDMFYLGSHYEWVENVARLSVHKTIVEFDTEAATLKETRALVPFPEFGTDVGFLAFPFAGGKTTLYLVKGPKDAANSDGTWVSRVELHRMSEKKHKVVLERGEYDLEQWSFYPSPDNKLMAIRCTTSGKSSKPWIFVIDEQGEFVAKIEE